MAGTQKSKEGSRNVKRKLSEMRAFETEISTVANETFIVS